MKRLFIILLICLFPICSFSQDITRGDITRAGIEITEEDLSPEVWPYQVKFTNGSVTDNLDGTTSVSTSVGDAPSTADYLVGTANGNLSAEIAVGTTPGGELGNTWASPTVDTTHSGSAHHSAVTISNTSTIDLTLATQAVSADLNSTLKSNYDTAYTDRLKWDGGATGLTAATGRTSLGLGTIATEPATNYFNTSLNTSDNITQGTTQLFVNTTEKANWNGVFANNHTIATLAGHNYLTLSGQQITAGDVALTTNTSGSYVASVATTAPVTGGAAGSEGATLTIAIPKGTTSVDGYINATDWTTFNNKGTSNLTANDTVYGAGWNGSVAEVPSQNVLWDKIETIAGGSQTPWTSDINGSTYNLTTTGNITAYNINATNNLLENGVRVVTTTLGDLVCTAPITGSANDIFPGATGTKATIAIPKATSLADGYLNMTDWSTFNNKVATTRNINTTAPITGGGDLSADRTIGITLLGDIATTAPITGAASDIFPGSDGVKATIAIPKANSTTDGYLNATDWTTFNGKGTAAYEFGANNFNGTGNFNTTGNIVVGNITVSGTVDGVDVSTLPTQGTWTDYGATSTIVGWSSYVVKTIYYKKIGNICFVSYRLYGTSNSASITFTLPYAAYNDEILYLYGTIGNTLDNGAWQVHPGIWTMEPNSATVTCKKDGAYAAWTASGDKLIYGSFFYVTVP